jgi:hypothetical protein
MRIVILYLSLVFHLTYLKILLNPPLLRSTISSQAA